ncbi:MAG: hypothetical protein K6U74_06920 [Firmicutes bacterium]|nr:hypothetical protein [Bacillota bacterium]
MIAAGFPSLPFFRKAEKVKAWLLLAGITLCLVGLCPHGLALVAAGLSIGACQRWWFGKGWKLSRSLGLREYMLLESNIKIGDLPPGKVFENHLQLSLSGAVKKILKKPDFSERTAEMKRFYFDDYAKIAEACRSGRWGERVYIVGTTHPTMMDWWVRSFTAAGFKAVKPGCNIDPGARLSRVGWWLAQVAATGHARSKKPPESWETCIAVWEGGE